LRSRGRVAATGEISLTVDRNGSHGHIFDALEDLHPTLRDAEEIVRAVEELNSSAGGIE
jgi:hypothetical protein